MSSIADAERNAPAEPGVAAALARALKPLDLYGRLAAISVAIPGRVVFTSSFGLEDQAIAHAIFTQGLAIEVVTFDTGRLFPETYQVWADTEQRYGVRVRAFMPDDAAVEMLVAEQGVDGFRNSVAARHACCAVRKVMPLARALAGAVGWVTGMRGDQSADRATLPAAAFDAAHGLIKVNPLFDWSRPQTLEFARSRDVPVNTLHDRGFLSIGCAPCTRAVAPGEDERAGRWWWEQAEKKECGLHFGPDGRVQRAAAPVN
jgi:phosphoadenosine phosphosulfate reductase